MSLTIHQSGIDAAINAQASGFAGVTLNRVDLYNGSSKIKPLTLKGVQVIEPSRIYVVAQDSTTDVYDVTKMQFYTDGGVLFATAQNDDGSTIQSKAANSTLLLAHQLNLSANPGTVAPSGDVSIYAPQATESLLGTVEIATQEEVDTGTDHTRPVTPKTLKSRLASFVRNATESVKGFVEIATQTEANGSSDDSRAITPKKLHNRTATESRRGVAEVATQTETNAGTDDSRIVTPKKLWALLTARFARKDVRPIFAQGINTGGKPIVYSGSGTNTDHIWYNDTDNTYHAVADASEGATGNANFKMGGIQLSSGDKITGYSDTITSTSNTVGATVGGVKKAYDAGTRQATESQRGQAEIATQAEVNAGTDHQRIVTPKTLKSRLASFTRNATETVKGFLEIATQAETEAGTDDSRAVTPKKLRWGFSYYLGQSGYIKLPNWLHGAIIQWGAVVITSGGQDVLVTFPLAFPNQVFGVCASYRGAAFATNPGKGLTCTPVSLSQFNLNTFSTMEGSGDQAFFYISIGK